MSIRQLVMMLVLVNACSLREDDSSASAKLVDVQVWLKTTHSSSWSTVGALRDLLLIVIWHLTVLIAAIDHTTIHHIGKAWWESTSLLTHWGAHASWRSISARRCHHLLVLQLLRVYRSWREDRTANIESIPVHHACVHGRASKIAHVAVRSTVLSFWRVWSTWSRHLSIAILDS